MRLVPRPGLGPGPECFSALSMFVALSTSGAKKVEGERAASGIASGPRPPTPDAPRSQPTRAFT